MLFFLLQWVIFTVMVFVPTPGASGGAEAAFLLVYSALLPVRIIGILEISEPKVMPGTGMAMYTISYRAVVWQPFRGEVVDGEVSQVVNNGFFVDVGALSVFVSKAVSLRSDILWRRSGSLLPERDLT